MSLWMVGVAALNALTPQKPILTLDEAMSIAEKNAFPVRLAMSAVDKAKFQLAEAKAQLGPTLNLGATYTRFDKAIIQDFGGGGGSTVVRPIDSKTMTLTLQIPVILSKTLNLGMDTAKYNIKVNEASLSAARNTLKLNVRQAYYRAVQGKWQVKVATDALSNAKVRLTNAEIREREGELAKVDVLRFRTEVAQREGDLVSAANGMDLAKNNLNDVIGRPIESDFETEEIPAAAAPTTNPDTLAAMAIKNRPEIESLRNSVEVFKRLRLIEQHQMDPSLSFSINHSRNLGTLGFGGVDASTTGVLALTWPLYDSGVTRAKTNAAREDEKQAQIRLEQTTLGVSLEVRQATTNLSNAQAALAAANRQQEFAAETYRLSVLRYEAGEGIQLEVIDAQTQLTAAQTAVASAKYNVLIAYAQLQAAVGTDALPGPTQTGAPH